MLIEDVKGFFVLNWDQLNFHYVKVDTNGPAKYLFTQQRMKKCGFVPILSESFCYMYNFLSGVNKNYYRFSLKEKKEKR